MARIVAAAEAGSWPIVPKKRLPPLTSGGTDSDRRRFAETDLGVHLAAQNNAPDCTQKKNPAEGRA